MIWVGITGGIATGKSEVIKILQTKGYKIVDADKIVHDLLKNNKKIISKIKNEFGNQVINENNEVKRQDLGRIVFSDKIKLRKLESIIHPAVKEQVKKFKLQNKNAKICFYDVPLLFENKMEKDFDFIVCVYTPKEKQIERMIMYRKLTKNEANNRIKAQLDIETKKQKANYVIDNSKDLKSLKKEVENVLLLITRPKSNQE